MAKNKKFKFVCTVCGDPATVNRLCTSHFLEDLDRFEKKSEKANLKVDGWTKEKQDEE